MDYLHNLNQYLLVLLVFSNLLLFNWTTSTNVSHPTSYRETDINFAIVFNTVCGYVLSNTHSNASEAWIYSYTVTGAVLRTRRSSSGDAYNCNYHCLFWGTAS